MRTGAADDLDHAQLRADVQELLQSYVAEQGTHLDPLGQDAARLVDAAREAVSGGKRLRASFCVWGFRAVRPERSETEERGLLRAAAAVEMLHASALVHDDLMDGSDTRRGRPSTHRAFEALHRSLGWPGDPERYGVAAAVLLGDLLLSWADELLRTSGFPDETVMAAMRIYDSLRSEVVAGQFLDVSVQARGRSSVEEAMRVLLYKSAKYSVERPLHLGAALAGGGPTVSEALSRYGVPLGQAFQLRDDLLGVFGDEAVTGKPAGDDLAEGKRTVLVALALEGAVPAEAARLDAQLGRRLSAEEVSEIREIVLRTGARDEVERRITDLATDALAALDAAPVTPQARLTLRELAAAATQRTV